MTHSKFTLSLLSIAVIGLFSAALSSKETKKNRLLSLELARL